VLNTILYSALVFILGGEAAYALKAGRTPAEREAHGQEGEQALQRQKKIARA
jgi:hypothetical protein